MTSGGGGRGGSTVQAGMIIVPSRKKNAEILQIFRDKTHAQMYRHGNEFKSKR